jgi:GDP/UDP-N,N'-diacetylbacillosamine 2-epimerase (hydrolysing)
VIKKISKNENYRKSLSNCKNPYGNGKSSKKIVDKIEKIQINEKLLIKDITY